MVNSNENKVIKVSVVIPCYNDGGYIRNALNSVITQNFKDYEIIIVDDGSNEKETIEILNEIEREKDVNILRKINGGPGSARNAGIEIANGKYILTLDADDKIDSTYLSKTVTKLDKSPTNIAFINTYWEFFRDKKGISIKKEYNKYDLAWENIVGNNCLFKKEVWKQVGGYATNIDGIEDWDFWIKIVNSGYEWYLIPEPLMHYRARANSLSKNNGKRIRELGLILLENNKEFFINNYKEIYLKGNERWYAEYSKNN